MQTPAVSALRRERQGDQKFQLGFTLRSDQPELERALALAKEKPHRSPQVKMETAPACPMPRTLNTIVFDREYPAAQAGIEFRM